MKAVIISIRPKWCAKILNGKKTIEVRKTRPKLETPFKAYIYQTIPKSGDWNERDGKIIGEFVCDRIYTVDAENNAIMKNAIDGISFGDFLECAHLSAYDLLEYLSSKRLDREYNTGYGWHISELKIYEKPLYLKYFYNQCIKQDCEKCGQLEYDSARYAWWCDEKKIVKRPPQSWCYVDGVKYGGVE